MVEANFYKTLNEKCGVTNGNRLLLGVSGGVDSMVMLYLFAQIKERLDLDLAVVHFNHGLRSKESDRDEAFVKNQSKILGMPFYSRKECIKEVAATHHISIEMAGRIRRYHFFSEIKESKGYDYIVLAHHYQDQVETLLLHMIRGTGLKGLGAMEYNENGRIRPLLSLKKEELVEYSKEKKILFREDQSNQDCQFLRNRIRHELIPELKTYNPQIEKNFFHLTQIASEDDHLLEAMATKAFEKYVTLEGSLLRLHKDMKREPLSIRKRVFQKAFQQLTGHALEFVYLEQMNEWLEKDFEKTLSLPCKTVFKQKRIDFLLKKNNTKKVKAYNMMIEGLGRYVLPNNLGVLNLEIVEGSTHYKEALIHEAYLPLEFLEKGGMQVRNRKTGDVFEPLNFGHQVSLKDWMIKKKIPLELRDELPLVIDSNLDIIFIPEIGISQRGKINKKEKFLLHISYEK